MPKKTKDAQVRIPWRVEIADAVQDLAWSPDGRWLAVAEVSGPLILINGESGAVIQHWPGHDGGSLKLAWSRDSRWLASSGQDGQARLWNPDSDLEHRTVAGGNPWVGAVSFSPDADDRLITAAGKELRAWTLDGYRLHAIQPHTSTITDLAWNPQQPLLASSAFGKVHLWDWQTPDAPGEQVLPHSSPLLNVRWSPDGRYLVCGCQDNSLRCWTWPDAQDFQMSGYSAKLRTLAWDRHSRWLATGDREVVTVWDFSQGPPMGQLPRDLEAMTDRVLDLAFQPGGDWLAAGDQSGYLIVWNVAKKEFQQIWQGTLRDGFQRLAWHPHHPWLAVGGAEGAVSMLEIEV